MNILRKIARPLLAAPFIIDGIDALRNPGVHALRSREVVDSAKPLLDKAGVEVKDEALVTASRVMGATSLVAGLGLATGFAPRSSAAVLCALAVPVAIVNAPRSMRDRQIGDFSRRLAMIGALAIASTDRQGNPSAAWRLNAWQEARRRERVLLLESNA